MRLVIGIYLAAIVSANLLTAWLGPAFSVLSAFLFIGLAITLRDRLHDAWQGRHLKLKMAALIAGGSVVTVILNQGAATIATASVAAFAVSETADTIAYHLLRRQRWFIRSNGSNVVASALDSFIFPTLAFGGFMPLIVLGQFVAKVLGGLLAGLKKPKAVFIPLVLLAFPAISSAQIVSVDTGAIISNGETDPVAELFVATPPVLGFRVFGIATERLGADRLSYQTQLTTNILANSAGFLSVTGGALFLSFRDYEPWGMIGGQGTLFIPGTNLSLIGVASFVPADDWSQTFLLKLSATGLYVR